MNPRRTHESDSTRYSYSFAGRRRSGHVGILIGCDVVATKSILKRMHVKRVIAPNMSPADYMSLLLDLSGESLVFQYGENTTPNWLLAMPGGIHSLEWGSSQGVVSAFRKPLHLHHPSPARLTLTRFQRLYSSKARYAARIWSDSYHQWMG